MSAQASDTGGEFKVGYLFTGVGGWLACFCVRSCLLATLLMPDAGATAEFATSVASFSGQPPDPACELSRMGARGALLQGSPKCDLIATGLKCPEKRKASGTLKPVMQGEQSGERLAKRRQVRVTS